MYNVTAALALLSPLSSNNAEAAFRDGTLVITKENGEESYAYA